MVWMKWIHKMVWTEWTHKKEPHVDRKNKINRKNTKKYIIKM